MVWKKIDISPAWNFEENPEFVGIFVSVENNVGPNNANLYDFKTEDGKVAAIWGNKLLDNRFKSLEKGEKVKVVYKGKIKSKSSAYSYSDFDVFKDDKGDDTTPSVEEGETGVPDIPEDEGTSNMEV